MKYSCGLIFALAATAWGANVGDTYQQVLAEKGAPKSQIEAGSRRVLKYPDVTIEIRDNVVTGIKAVVAPPPQEDPPPPSPAAAAPPAATANASSAKAAALKKELNAAVQRVQAIVNQPVTAYVRTAEMKVGAFGPGGWFHAGALTPDFNKVDVRQSQQSPYDAYQYVASDLNPGVAFVGRDLEFNAMTKLFYTDRSVPKKKLTEDEMVEINRLYRIIGHLEQLLKQLPPS